MIIYIDLEHPRIKQHRRLWQHSYSWRLDTKYLLEEITGEPCLIVRYDRANPALLRRLQARAVVVSGCYTDFEHYSDESLAGLRQIYQEAAWPTIGFCAGQQLMAEAYGARLDAIGPLGPGEPDLYQEQGVTGHVPGQRAERGFLPVRLVGSHPLLAGLGDHGVFFQAHYWELKDLPSGFQNLASSDITPYQIIAHRERPLFGTQFHPEHADRDHPDGRRLIENFFEIAGQWPVDVAGMAPPASTATISIPGQQDGYEKSAVRATEEEVQP